MQKILILFLLLVFASCSDLEVRKQIETALKYESCDAPKLKMNIDLDSFDKAQTAKGIVSSPPHVIKYDESYGKWRFIIGSGSKKYHCSDGYKWKIYSSYDVEEFGAHSLSSPFYHNEIGYEMYGKQKDTINEIAILLNLHTKHQKQEALSKLSKYVAQISSQLDMVFPNELYQFIQKGELYFSENNLFYLMLQKNIKREKPKIGFGPNEESRYKFDKDKPIEYEQYKFIIKSK